MEREYTNLAGLRPIANLSNLDLAFDCDLACIGPIFLDVLYSPFVREARLGEELWTDQAVLIPGAVANVARAASNLGLDTSVATELGDGPISALVTSLLVREGLRYDASIRVPEWDVPVTSAIPIQGDRAMYTGGRPAETLVSDAQTLPISPRAASISLTLNEIPLLPRLYAQGTSVYADIGYDESGEWDVAVLRHLDHCFAFCPNEVEAMAYTRTASAEEAAKALSERVPLVIVTRGARGVYAIDSAQSRVVDLPSVPVENVNATGAGDTFLAGVIAAHRVGADLYGALSFAQTVAAARIGGSFGHGNSPTLDQLGEFMTNFEGIDRETVEMVSQSLRN